MTIRITLDHASDPIYDDELMEQREFKDAEEFVAFLKRTDLHQKAKPGFEKSGFIVKLSEVPGCVFDVIVRDDYVE
jgi:hypothetical protein